MIAVARSRSDWEGETSGSEVGSPEHHRECIVDYDLVLRVLREPEPVKPWEE